MSTAGLISGIESALSVHIGALALGPAASLLLLVALTTAAVAGIDLWRIGQREERQRRLDALRAKASDRNARPIIPRMQWYERIGSIVAASRFIGTAEQQRLLGALRKAGFRQRGTLARLVACKICAALLVPVLIWALLEAKQWLIGHTVYRVISLLGAIMVSWRLPDFVLARLAGRRRRLVEDGMPDALDLLVITAEAGLALDQGIEEVARNLYLSNRPIAEEFATTAAEMQILANRSEALENLVERTGLPSLRSMTAALSQSLRYGTPLTHSLRVIAAEMRNNRIARIEERAARLPVLLTIPMMLFIMPCLMIVIGTPIGLRVIDTMRNLFKL